MEKEKEQTEGLQTLSPSVPTSPKKSALPFIDQAIIQVSSGSGGPGAASFRREKFVPKGGPNGGDGGKGGTVIIQASPHAATLIAFRYRRIFEAENGKPGGGSRKFGKDGKDLIIDVPMGTVVLDAETGVLLRDLDQAYSEYVVAYGGKGGKGNWHFKGPTRQAPTYAQKGLPGEAKKLRLELKLLADVGLIGAPNAGKSTLLAAISAAKPKIAPYPFTTLSPNLAAVYRRMSDRPLIFADIPGLIQGAHEGKGLGLNFLKHVERTAVLLHLIDITGGSPAELLSQHDIILRELQLFNPNLLNKRRYTVLTKTDLVPKNVAHETIFALQEKLGHLHTISALTREGVDSLLSVIFKSLQRPVVDNTGET